MKITFGGSEFDDAFEVMKANLRDSGLSEMSADAVVQGAMRGVMQCMGANLSPDMQEFFLNMILNWGKPNHQKITKV